jgi:Holliday junction resolvase RusA-like endonuclease
MSDTQLLLELTVEGEPRAKGRPRFANGHAFTPPRTRNVETVFAWHARTAHRRPLTEPLLVCLDFYVGSRRRVDTDNLAKLALDACNGVVWADDSQIVELRVRREVDRRRPRTVLRVYSQPCVEDCAA